MIFCYRYLLKSKDIRFDKIFRTYYALVCLFLIYYMFYFFLYFYHLYEFSVLCGRNIFENLKIFHHQLCARYLLQSIQLNSWKIKGVFFLIDQMFVCLFCIQWNLSKPNLLSGTNYCVQNRQVFGLYRLN